jgi:multiple sugar transport system substrate-binding protein
VILEETRVAPHQVVDHRCGRALGRGLERRLEDHLEATGAAARDEHRHERGDARWIAATNGSNAAAGIQLASEHVMSGYVVWKFSKSQDVAKEFLVALVDASRESMLASKLYNFPSFYGAAADPGTAMNKKSESGAAWIAKQCNADPFGSQPGDKLSLLAKALPWSTNLGYPGFANPAEGEIFDTYVITDMFAKAAQGTSPEDAVKWAAAELKKVYEG